MSVILLIESSSHNCSVGIAEDGVLLAFKEVSSHKYIHAENLHPFIISVLSSCGRGMNDIQAVALSSGPGSYTGLRIGVSAAKGICYALNIPLISIPTTLLLAHHAKAIFPLSELYLPMIDARRMEVYYAVFNQRLEQIKEDAAQIIDEVFFKEFNDTRLILVGDGAAKCVPFVRPGHEILDTLPSVTMMPELAHQLFIGKNFVPILTFEPFYLKEFVAIPAKKML